MTSSHNRIIRGANVEGTIYCSPSGQLVDEDPNEKQEKQNLKSLENFWYHKGCQEGKKAGFQEGMSEGEKKGYQKGYDEGKKEGFEEGNNQGHQAGFEEGCEQTQQELKDVLTLMRSVGEEVKNTGSALVASAKPEIIKFALQVAKAMLKRDLANPEAMKKQIEMVLSQANPMIKEHAGVDLYLHPADLEMMDGKLSNLDVDDLKADSIRFLVDSSMTRGDCRAETSLGMVNFDIHRLLDDLERRALEVRTDDGINAEVGSTTPEKAMEEEERSTNPVG